METVALESDGKQVERSRNGTKRLKIVQKAFSHFFVYGISKSSRPQSLWPGRARFLSLPFGPRAAKSGCGRQPAKSVWLPVASHTLCLPRPRGGPFICHRISQSTPCSSQSPSVSPGTPTARRGNGTPGRKTERLPCQQTLRLLRDPLSTSSPVKRRTWRRMGAKPLLHRIFIHPWEKSCFP